MSDAAVLRRLLGLAAPHRGRLALATVLGFLCTGCGIGLMATSAWLIARASQRPPILSLTVAIVAVRFFGIGRGVLRYLERLATHDASFRLLADLRVAVYERLEPLAPGGLDAHRSGDLLRRAVGDVDALQQFYARVVTPPAVAVLTAALAAGLTAAMLPGAAASLLLAMAAAGVGVPVLAHRLSRRGTAHAAALHGELQAQIVEMLQGAAELLAFGALEERLAAIARVDAALCETRRRTAWVAGLCTGATVGLGGLAVWLSLALGVPAVRAGALDGLLLGTVVLTAMAAFEAVTPLPAAFTGLREALGAARRLFALTDAALPVCEPRRPRPLPASTEVVVRHARARYAENRPWALDGVDLDLVPGRRVAVVGASGAGKSTLAAVLLRFRELQGGEATLGGAPIASLAAEEVRGVIGLCGQDAHVFATSVRENLRLARPEATDAELVDAARRARILDWIEALPQGWDTLVGELGARMSGGERRRLALARALLADFPILVLDEPTANLDAQTEAELTRDLLEVTRGRAVLLITHRLAGLEDVDEICVMEGGRIVERGTHARLISHDGPYRRLREAEEPPSPATPRRGPSAVLTFGPVT